MIEGCEGDAIGRLIKQDGLREIFLEDLELGDRVLELLHLEEHITLEVEHAFLVHFREALRLLKTVHRLLQVARLVGQHAVEFGDIPHLRAVGESADELLAQVLGLADALQGRIGHDRAIHRLVTLREVFEVINHRIKGEDRFPRALHFEVAATQTIVERSVVVGALLQLIEHSLVRRDLGFQFFLVACALIDRVLEACDTLLLKAHHFALPAHRLVGSQRFSVALFFDHLIAQLLADIVELNDILSRGARAALHFGEHLASLLRVALGNVEISGHQRGLDLLSTAHAVSDDAGQDGNRFVRAIRLLIMISD